MTHIEFSLDFFAARLCTTPEKLHFCILERTYNDPACGVYRAPGLRVEGIKEYAYSLHEGCFVALGEVFHDSVVSMQDASVQPSENGYTFRTESGIEAYYTTHDLMRIWYTRLVNPYLK